MAQLTYDAPRPMPAPTTVVPVPDFLAGQRPIIGSDDGVAQLADQFQAQTRITGGDVSDGNGGDQGM